MKVRRNMSDTLLQRFKQSRLVRHTLRPAVLALRERSYYIRNERRNAPLILHIEPTAACNLKCSMCFRNTHTFNPSHMDFTLYENAVQQAARYGVQTLRLYLRGEPLMHPRITEMVARAKELGIPDVELNTNGQLLNREKSADLLDSGLDRILFSVEGYTRETYEKIRCGGSFERVVDNIRTFHSLREETASKTRMEIITVNQPDNPMPDSRFDEFWLPYVDDILIVGMVEHSGLDRGGYENHDPVTTPCAMLWDRLVILSDGVVPLCCVDIDATIVLGNIRTQSLPHIWKSATLKNIRKIHRSGRRPSISICARCSYMKPDEASQVSVSEI